MTQSLTQAMRRLPVALSFALAIIFLLGLPSMAAAAQPSADQPAAARPGPSKAEVDELVRTLQDPAARQKLIDQLHLMVAAEKNGHAPDSPNLLSLVTDQLQEVSDQLLSAVAALADVGHLGDWVQRQVTDARQRSLWTEVLGKLAAIFGGGWLAERGTFLALRRPRRLLLQRPSRDRLLRVPTVTGVWLLDLLPVGVFLLVAYGLSTLTALALTGAPHQAIVLLVLAYALARFLLVLVGIVLMPGHGGLRVPPIDDETANYLFIWARRLTLTGVWGYSLAQALRLLGLPKSGYDFVLKALGLTVAVMLVILVLQNRQAIGDRIRGMRELNGFPATLRGMRHRLADVWHILAAAYIVATYCVWALQVRGGFEFIVRASLLTVAIVVLANLLTGVLIGAVNRAFAISADLRRQFPHLEARANRYLAIMRNMVRVVVVLAAVLALGQAWGANTLAWLNSDAGRHIVSSSLMIAAVIIGALVLWEQVSLSIERYLSKTDADGVTLARGTRARTLLPLLRHVILIFLVVVVGLIVLSELGLNIAPLLAGAGVIGVAIGFGSQKLVQDVITGAFILFEDTIAIGDSVKIEEYTGTVEGMSIRTVRLRDVNGRVHTLPFSNIKSVTNMSRGFGCHVFEIGVSYKEDVDRVMEVIRALGDEMQADGEIGQNISGPIEIFGVDKLADSAVVIMGRLTTLPGKQWPVGREFNRRVKKRFDELGIEIPYPTRTLFLGTDKDGGVPPLPLRLEPRTRPMAGPASPTAEDGRPAEHSPGAPVDG